MGLFSFPVVNTVHALTITCCCAFTVAPAVQEVKDIAKETKAQEEIILKGLRDQNLWQDAKPFLKDPRVVKTLAELLNATAALRMSSAVPVLVKHIDYNPNPLKGGQIPTEIEYPAYGALIAVGIPAVPGLLGLLKTTDPEANFGSNAKKHVLAVHCLIEIYNRGGYGKELARQRIQLELKKVPEKDRKLLRSALECWFLKD